MKRTMSLEEKQRKEMLELIAPTISVYDEHGGTTREEELWKDFFNSVPRRDESICKYLKLNVGKPFNARMLFLELSSGGIIPFYVNTNKYSLGSCHYPRSVFSKNTLENIPVSQANDLYKFCYNVAKYFYKLLKSRPHNVDDFTLDHIDNYIYNLIDIVCFLKLSDKNEIEEFLDLIKILDFTNPPDRSMDQCFYEDMNTLKYFFQSKIDISIKMRAVEKMEKYFYELRKSSKDEMKKVIFIENFYAYFLNWESYGEAEKKMLNDVYRKARFQLSMDRIYLSRDKKKIFDIILSMDFKEYNIVIEKVFYDKNVFRDYLVANIKALLSLDGYELKNESIRSSNSICIDSKIFNKIMAIISEYDLSKYCDEMDRIVVELNKRFNKKLEEDTRLESENRLYILGENKKKKEIAILLKEMKPY